MIEHKSIPEIDSDIFAECQAMLLNFDKIIEKEFGTEYCIRESLSFALQLYPSIKSLNSAIIENPNAKTIVDFIKAYRSTITTEILNSGEYSFKAFLIQVANHESKSALPIQFIAFDKLDDAQKNSVNRVAALVKNKFVTVPIANKDLFKPTEVVKQVQALLGDPKINKGKKQVDKFNMDTHTRCWKKYNIRPENSDPHPEVTVSKYCVFDVLNNIYGYSEEWVDFLVSELQNGANYRSLFK
jgi:hypothetical protein